MTKSKQKPTSSDKTIRPRATRRQLSTAELQQVVGGDGDDDSPSLRIRIPIG